MARAWNISKVILDYDKDYEDWMIISCPYETHFVKALKTSIDPSQRWWDKENKTWHIRSAFIKDILPLCRKYYEQVECRVNAKEILATTQVNVFSQLFKRITPDYADKVYKALAHVVHPDKGGDMELMKQLNLAYNERKRQMGG